MSELGHADLVVELGQWYAAAGAAIGTSELADCCRTTAAARM